MSVGISSPTPDATTTTKGKVQLAGDLSGTAALPTIAANAVTVVRLNAVESTDFQNGTALTATTWTDFKADQNFTVNSTTSVIAINITAGCIIGGGTGTPDCTSRIIIDSAGTPITRYYGSGRIAVAGQFTNPFNGGTIYVTGLAAGTHTVKTQVYITTGSNQMLCRCTTVPNQEFYTTAVVEFKK